MSTPRPHPAARAAAPAQTSDDPEPPESPFAASSPTVPRPPLARLASTQLTRASPLVFDSLTRASLPSSSLSDAPAPYVDLLRPDGSQYSPPRSGAGSAQMQRSGSAGGSPTSSLSRRGGAARPRSSSISSLQSLMGKGGAGAARRASMNGGASLARSTSRTSGTEEAIEEEVQDETRAKLDQLSWGTRWWPFSVVEPDSTSKTAASQPLPPTPPVKDPHDASRGFLSLFAGKEAVEQAKKEHEVQERQDQLEADLLDATLDELSIAASRSDETFATLEADDLPPEPPRKRSSVDKSLPPSPPRSPPSAAPSSFLPSLFSSSTTATTSASTSSSPSAFSKAMDAPASLLTSLTASNPFTSSTSSFFTSSAKSPTSERPPHLARHYSTKRHPSAEDGPTAKPHEVEELVDRDDRETIKEEVEENAEMFSLLKDKYRAPKLPLVFCHGLFGFDYLGPAGLKPLRFSYWIGVEEALEAMGVEVMIGRVPASASIEERAKVLCQMIGERFPGREVNLIGHSMGGLDGRFLISRLKPTNFKVRSLTTISTPHRGSSFADYLLEDVLGAERVPSFLRLMSSVGVPGGGKAFDDLTTTKMARFNEETPDDPSVKYISFGAEFTPSWSNAFRIPWGIVHEREGANDGLVSVESAKWGDYRATLHNVNHLDLIGWVGKVRYSYAAWTGHEIKFRPVSFFSSMAEMLADEGL
ncbi:hypothetical protein Rhopal_002517-T1 [Rhodotorula paludigena]|uniref:GPI inositol-deacylase n=1 Tax=Rhodotorula paludigena TaxID=86838 RepID=A0AAV5GI91_9BASI|nr:hypothetical protein Rhopal_002517-T1 [Rhodotorula paludigena]